MADSAPPKPKTIRDWLNRPREEKTDVIKQRTELWEALNAFVSQEGGWVTSVPGAKNLRIETPSRSSLPA